MRLTNLQQSSFKCGEWCGQFVLDQELRNFRNFMLVKSKDINSSWLLSFSLVCVKCNVTGDDKIQLENFTAIENTQANFTIGLPFRTEEKFRIDVKVCQEEFLHTFCTCRWLSITNSPKCTTQSKDFICKVDNSGMRMSFVVTRTDTDVFWMIFEQNSPQVLLKHTLIHVTYPPQITQLFVNGEPVNETHIIDEKQEINISCNFTNGNPPVSIRLLNDTGHTLSSTTDIEGPLTMFLGVYHCHDLWPTLSCEAPGSELNRSVDILVRCPPQLTFMSTQVVESTSVAEGLNIGLRSYTSNITKCLMMKSDSGETIRKVTYELSGHAPMFNLTLRLAKQSWVGQGNWTLKVENEFGDTNITFEFINTITQTLAKVRKTSKAFLLKDDLSPSSEDPQQSVPTVVIISGCLLSITASSVGILLLCLVKTRQGVWGRRRSQFLVPASVSQDNTEEQPDVVLNEAGGFQAISDTVSSGAELLEPTSSPRRADGLKYGELEFSDRTPSNVIIGSLPNTQYAQINFADLDYPSQK